MAAAETGNRRVPITRATNQCPPGPIPPNGRTKAAGEMRIARSGLCKTGQTPVRGPAPRASPWLARMRAVQGSAGQESRLKRSLNVRMRFNHGSFGRYKLVFHLNYLDIRFPSTVCV